MKLIAGLLAALIVLGIAGLVLIKGPLQINQGRPRPRAGF